MTYIELKQLLSKYLGNWGSAPITGTSAIKTITALHDGSGNAITSTSNKLDVNLDAANSEVTIYGSDDGGTTRRIIKTDSGGAVQVDIESGTITTISTLTSGNVGGFTTLVQSTVVMSVAGAYATGDYMGTTTTPQSFASAVRTSGGTGIIKSVLISDKITNTNVAMELWILDRTYTAPTDNAAWNMSDADMLFVQAVIPIATTGWYASSAGQVYFDGTLSIPIKSNTQALFYALVARGTTPAFTSSDLTITLGLLQD